MMDLTNVDQHIVDEFYSNIKSHNCPDAFLQKVEDLYALSGNNPRFFTELVVALRLKKYDGDLLAVLAEVERVFFSLEQQLYNACNKSVLDFNYIEKLLQEGANPNGPIFAYGLANMYDEILDNWLFDDDYEPLIRLTDLLYRYGLDIFHPVIPYDDNVIHPYWTFGFSYPGCFVMYCYFFDKGVDAKAIETAIGHATLDLCLDDVDLDDEDGMKYYLNSIKMFMLAASYHELIEKADWIRQYFDFEHNDYETTRFRNLDNYRIDIEFADDRYHFARDSIARIVEKDTGVVAWKFQMRF